MLYTCYDGAVSAEVVFIAGQYNLIQFKIFNWSTN